MLLFEILGLFAVNGYEIVYPFKADSTGNKRELSTNANGMIYLLLMNQIIISITNGIEAKELNITYCSLKLYTH